MKTRITPILTVAALVVAALPAAAQEARGTLLGRVTDPTDAVIVAAKVDATNTATGVHLSTITNSSGDFLLPFLLPGPYRLTVESRGFRTYSRDNIQVRESDRVAIDVAMQVGESSQTVAVTAESPILDTSTASVGQVMDSRAIADLPTKDGMVLVAATLAPGVIFTPQTAAYIRPFDTGSPSSMTVNGTRPGSNEFQVDGSPNIQGQQIAYSPPQSVVSEFKVQTATFDASWGFNVGASMNMTLKTGANAPHGMVDYFMQNPALNSNNYFRLATGKPGFRIHRYGASLTGPVYIPKVYDGRNKTFFTYAYEGIWSFDPSPWVVESAPTAAERGGDFSGLLGLKAPNADGSDPYQIYDPYSTKPAAGGHFSRSPLLNNRIPGNLISPTARNIAALWDQANQAGTVDGTNNYTMGKNAQDTYWNHLARVDHNISDKQRVYVRANFTSLERPENIRESKTVGDNFYRFNQGAVADDVYTITPRFFVDSRYSFMRFRTGYTPYQQGWDLASLGFSSSFIDQLKQLDPRALKFPNINVAGYSPLGGVNSNNQQVYTIHEFAVNATNIVGQHTVRSGITYRDYLLNNYDLGSSSGSLTFDSTWTKALDTSSASPIGQGMAGFLYGLPASGTFPINDNYAEKTRYWALFAQDDWKVSRKLTLSLGLRYELPSPLTERYNRSVQGFDAGAALPIANQVMQNYAAHPITAVPASQFQVAGGLTFPGVGGSSRSLWNTASRNFMPRLGFAYSMTPRTVIRAGFGIYFVPLGVTNVNVNQTGFSGSTALVPSLDNGQTYIASLANPFPGGFLRGLGAAGGASTFLGQNISFFDQGLRNPYMQRWQFAVQRELPGRSVFEISYVGNRGTRLLATRDLDPIPRQYLSASPVRDQGAINALSAAVSNPFYPLLPRTNLAAATVATSQLLRPYPQFSGVTASENAGFSWYHAMQARVEKRLSNGLSALYSLSWSKMMEATGYLNPTDMIPEKVISDQDRPFRSAVAVVYELPFGQGKRFGTSTSPVLNRMIGGWQVQGIYTNQSGQALGFGNAILTCAPSQVALSKSARTVGQWFNTSCFNRVASQQLGSNIQTLSTRFTGIRGPGINNWDISVIKNTRIKEGANVQFTAEAINAMNHPQFTTPNTSPTSTAFGQITGSFNWQRIVEFGIKLSF